MTLMSEEELKREIAGGEGSALEFKSTLRWNIKANKNDDAITLAVLKTIAGFLNTGPGLVFIGVRDDGSVHGIAEDGFKNDDQFVVTLYGYVKTAMGPDVAACVNATVHQLDGKTVCRISVSPSPSPVFVTFATEKDAFFIRTGPDTTKLPASKHYLYIKEHWTSSTPEKPRPKIKLEYVSPREGEECFRFHNLGEAAAFNVSTEIPLSDTLWAVKFGPCC